MYYSQRSHATGAKAPHVERLFPVAKVRGLGTGRSLPPRPCARTTLWQKALLAQSQEHFLEEDTQRLTTSAFKGGCCGRWMGQILYVPFDPANSVQLLFSGLVSNRHQILWYYAERKPFLPIAFKVNVSCWQMLAEWFICELLRFSSRIQLHC